MRLRTKPNGGEFYFAAHLPLTMQNYPVKTSWGDTLLANRPGIPHGKGDFLVCPSVNDKPNLNDVWVVNGEVFGTTYDMRAFPGLSTGKKVKEVPIPKPLFDRSKLAGTVVKAGSSTAESKSSEPDWYKRIVEDYVKYIPILKLTDINKAKVKTGKEPENYRLAFKSGLRKDMAFILDIDSTGVAIRGKDDKGRVRSEKVRADLAAGTFEIVQRIIDEQNKPDFYRRILNTFEIFKERLNLFMVKTDETGAPDRYKLEFISLLDKSSGYILDLSPNSIAFGYYAVSGQGKDLTCGKTVWQNYTYAQDKLPFRVVRDRLKYKEYPEFYKKLMDAFKTYESRLQLVMTTDTKELDDYRIDFYSSMEQDVSYTILINETTLRLGIEQRNKDTIWKDFDASNPKSAFRHIRDLVARSTAPDYWKHFITVYKRFEEQLKLDNIDELVQGLADENGNGCDVTFNSELCDDTFFVEANESKIRVEVGDGESVEFDSSNPAGAMLFVKKFIEKKLQSGEAYKKLKSVDRPDWFKSLVGEFYASSERYKLSNARDRLIVPTGEEPNHWRIEFKSEYLGDALISIDGVEAGYQTASGFGAGNLTVNIEEGGVISNEDIFGINNSKEPFNFIQVFIQNRLKHNQYPEFYKKVLNTFEIFKEPLQLFEINRNETEAPDRYMIKFNSLLDKSSVYTLVISPDSLMLGYETLSGEGINLTTSGIQWKTYAITEDKEPFWFVRDRIKKSEYPAFYRSVVEAFEEYEDKLQLIEISTDKTQAPNRYEINFFLQLEQNYEYVLNIAQSSLDLGRYTLSGKGVDLTRSKEADWKHFDINNPKEVFNYLEGLINSGNGSTPQNINNTAVGSSVTGGNKPEWLENLLRAYTNSCDSLQLYTNKNQLITATDGVKKWRLDFKSWRYPSDKTFDIIYVDGEGLRVGLIAEGGTRASKVRRFEYRDSVGAFMYIEELIKDAEKEQQIANIRSMAKPDGYKALLRAYKANTDRLRLSGLPGANGIAIPTFKEPKEWEIAFTTGLIANAKFTITYVDNSTMFLYITITGKEEAKEFLYTDSSGLFRYIEGTIKARV